MRAELPPTLLTLRNILDLEERRGFDDRAVVGGLAALVLRLAPNLNLTPDTQARVRAYGDTPPGDRAQVVAALRAALQAARTSASGPSSSPPLPPPPPPRPASRVASTRAERRPSTQFNPGSPITVLSGVGPTRARRLAALGITTVGDLRFHLPHRYVPYPPPVPAAELGFQHLASFEGKVLRVDVAPLPGKRLRITAILGDATGRVAAVWIRGGGVPGEIHQGALLAISGPLLRQGQQTYFENPEYEPATAPPLNTRRTVPVYPLTEGITQSFMRGLVRQGLAALPPAEEWLPDWIRQREELLELDEALHEIHRPTSTAQLERARLRLAFDELLPMQIRTAQRRRSYQLAAAVPVDVPWALLAEFRSQLPFPLTGGQQRVLSTLLSDIAQPRPMVRLLQGEVGSGKTVVAAMLLLAVVASGGQGTIMAPTEILAEQHLRTLRHLYDRAAPQLEAALGHPVRLALLSGAVPRAERQPILSAIAAGQIDIVVGTHAVIEGDVEFARLLLAVVDEQHRFGVSQRVAVRRKGQNPHLLVMTATPIPRTLALTLFGDLDISQIDELPAGRQPVETVLLRPLGRPAAYERIRAAVAAGHQAFVICPLVDGSLAVEARAAVTEYERLRQGELRSLRLGLLHGRMRPTEKDAVMRAFAAGDFDVLVATSVVEVGVDVPNATVMVIEGAERFGLAQLHQFRGRVGRGGAPASCFLIAGSEAPEALERLEAVVRSSSGAELAEEDLRLRGPGDYLGLRQSGLPSLRVARLTDLELVERVRRAASAILERDPRLSSAEHLRLSRALDGTVPDGFEPN